MSYIFIMLLVGAVAVAVAVTVLLLLTSLFYQSPFLPNLDNILG
jgi:hypothetical protein